MYLDSAYIAKYYVDEPESWAIRALVRASPLVYSSTWALAVLPEVRYGSEIPAVRQSETQHDSVNAAGRCPADDIDDDVGIDQIFQKRVHAVAADGAIEFLRDAIFIDGKRNAAVENDSQTDFTAASLVNLSH